ncbi:ankyrin-3-like [Trichogramma pretiosum]|uniref:ankyrin-3-like n=1 Tax=Trichogramma pretiosum TaxID=7493 RepID=UPI000C718A75|nr:ankyrin-3-like [Trichogramma pretiosum]
MNCLKKLKIMREGVNWKIKKDRVEFLRQLYPLVGDWKGKLPNLRNIFRGTEVDWLLVESVKSLNRLNATLVDQFIGFVVRTGYKDVHQVDADGDSSSRRTTAIHWAAKINRSSIIPDLFKIYERFDVNYTDKSGMSHFHLACQYDCVDVVEKFLELGQDPNLVVPKTADSSLHLALRHKHKKVVELLLINGADPNLSNQDGLTALHIVSQEKLDVDFAEMIFELSNEKYHPVQIDVQEKGGDTSLHLAVRKVNKKVAELLLRRGANLNLVNKRGSTSLHIICQRHNHDDAATLELFFNINEEVNESVQIDAQNKNGNASLHLALDCGLKEVAQFLLRRGADPHLANKNGSTPLHVICSRYSDDESTTLLFNLFFEVTNDMHQTVDVNARDKSGSTPLHDAVNRSNKKITELLLRKGASPNSADENGSTPLHVICVDALDKSGRTPLQEAVANFMPNSVDILLTNGADLSKFVFPTESDFDCIFESYLDLGDEYDFRLEQACGVLACVERLEKHKYEMERVGALTIMKTFAKHHMLNNSVDINRHLSYYKKFEESSKNQMINPKLSLYDLLQLRPSEATESFTMKELMSLANSKEFHMHVTCTEFLCEIKYRKFCRRWTLEFFLSLTRYQLPILCCDMIVDMLTKEDWLKICLAAEIDGKE